MKLQLTNGATYGYDNRGQKVCTGSQMGRPNVLPFQYMGTNAEPIKLQMERLKWVDGDYDQKGAYWGRSDNEYIFCAWAANAQVFVRAKTRNKAKNLVRERFPKAKFYR